MLAIVVVAALTPNIGVGTAALSPQYQSGPSPNNTLEFALIGVLVAAIVAAVIGLLVFQRRRNRGSGGAGGVAAWQEPPSGPSESGPSESGPSMDTSGGAPGVYQEMAPAGVTAEAAAPPPSYDETPPTEPAPGADWVEPSPPSTMGGGAAPAPPLMDESEPDIDRLMKELDQISDDILKKAPAKKGSPPEPPPDESET
jgi:hypothetical protein